MPLSLGIAVEISAVPFTEEKPEEKPFTCNLCQRQFSLMGVLKAHFQRTHPDQPFKTSYSVSSSHAEKNLAASSPKSSEVRRTLSNLFAKNDSSHKCDVCQKDFPKRIELIKHRFVHKRFPIPNLNCMITSNNSYQCNTCKKEFYKAHHFKLHTNVKCELCSYMHCHTWLYSKQMCPEEDECIYCKRELCERCHNLHLTEKKTYVKKPEEPQECVLCKEIFESKKILKEHYVTFHKLKNVI